MMWVDSRCACQIWDLWLWLEGVVDWYLTIALYPDDRATHIKLNDTFSTVAVAAKALAVEMILKNRQVPLIP